MKLPEFKYHPDPLATGALEESAALCDCCGQARGYRATANFYAAERVKNICPWCIADGSAAQKYAGSFSDDFPLLEAGIEVGIICEVCERTPGFISWQQERWLSHCHDACEFHGDAEKSELEALQGDALAELLQEEMLSPEVWSRIVSHYQKGGEPAVYKFICRHCGQKRFYVDFP